MAGRNQKHQCCANQCKPTRGLFITPREYLSLVRKIAILEERIAIKTADFETLMTMYMEQNELLSVIESNL